MALSNGYKYDKATVNGKAPAGAGVYALYKQNVWIYFGEAINIRDRLVQHLDREENRCITVAAPTGFCFELVAGGKLARVARQDELILQNRNHPLCNQRLG